MSAAQLVFHQAVRGAPSLHRGWRTPDPSPTRACEGLPGCLRGAGEWVVELSESAVALPLPESSWARLQAEQPQLKFDTTAKKDLCLTTAKEDLDLLSTPKGQSLAWSAEAAPLGEDFAAREWAGYPTAPSTPRGHTVAWSAKAVPPEELGDDRKWVGYTTTPSTTHASGSSTPTEPTEEGPFCATAAALAELEATSGAAPAARPAAGAPPGAWALGASCQPSAAAAAAAFPSDCCGHSALPGPACAAMPVHALWLPAALVPFVGLESLMTAQRTTEVAARPEVPVCVSVGSVGHPHACAEACKFAWKRRGCKDGAACVRCHLCAWQKHGSKKDFGEAKPAWAFVALEL